MTGSWDRRRAAAIAAGGALGASARWVVLATVDAGLFPWPLLVLNIAGSVLLGALLAAEAAEATGPPGRLLLHDAGAIGFCGGLTTFSTFALELVDLLDHGRIGTAVAYGVASLGGTIAGVVAGAAALRRISALELPLEEMP